MHVRCRVGPGAKLVPTVPIGIAYAELRMAVVVLSSQAVTSTDRQIGGAFDNTIPAGNHPDASPGVWAGRPSGCLTALAGSPSPGVVEAATEADRPDSTPGPRSEPGQTLRKPGCPAALFCPALLSPSPPSAGRPRRTTGQRGGQYSQTTFGCKTRPVSAVTGAPLHGGSRHHDRHAPDISGLRRWVCESQRFSALRLHDSALGRT
jgi:hypothetical protein